MSLFSRVCGFSPGCHSGTSGLLTPCDICDQSCLSSLGTEAVVMELFLGRMGQQTRSFAGQSHGTKMRPCVPNVSISLETEKGRESHVPDRLPLTGPTFTWLCLIPGGTLLVRPAAYTSQAPEQPGWDWPEAWTPVSQRRSPRVAGCLAWAQPSVGLWAGPSGGEASVDPARSGQASQPARYPTYRA